MRLNSVVFLVGCFVLAKSLKIDICSQPKDPGPCQPLIYIPTFYYNSATKNCEEFGYGGCEGNLNRFDTSAECEVACTKENKGKPGACPPILFQPPCQAKHACSKDTDCDGEYKCCTSQKSNCRECMKGHDDTPRPGECPAPTEIKEFHNRQICDLFDCSVDSMCSNETEKCCKNECGSQLCMAPKNEGKTCPLNEEYQTRASRCTDQCGSERMRCAADFEEGCFCKSGYGRKNKICLPRGTPNCSPSLRPPPILQAPSDDHNMICLDPNEESSDCGSSCSEQCSNGTTMVACPALCEKGCFCRDGYGRANGKCVKRESAACGGSDKPGACPPILFQPPCQAKHACSKDTDCDGEYKCCTSQKSNCRECMKGHDDTPRPGECPAPTEIKEFHNRKICDLFDCSVDSMCSNQTEKCCKNECGSQLCMAPKQEDQKCPPNEQYSACGSGCMEQCGSESAFCIMMCEEGCFCKQGYGRKGKICLPRGTSQCSPSFGPPPLPPPQKEPVVDIDQPECPANEEFSTCGSSCNEPCNSEWAWCDLCEVGCFCKEGYGRRNDTVCVPRGPQCGPEPEAPVVPECPPNEEYKECNSSAVAWWNNSRCAESCGSESADCAYECLTGCFCKRGYGRKETQCLQRGTPECSPGLG